MPDTGRLNMYNLGVHLREVYGQLLGDIFTTEVMKMHTTEYPLSMMSAQLVNAGLWPPAESQVWNSDLNWQPIPTEYVSIDKDTLLLGTRCPNFISEMKRVLSTPEMQRTMLHYLPLFNYVSKHSGMEIKEPFEAALLYATLETKADLNQSLPDWAEEIFPHGSLYNVTLLEYDLLSQTKLQRQLNGGTIIKEILANTLDYIQENIPEERKLMIYSGNDRNIAAVLKSLNLWSPHIPNEGASVIFELYFDNETQSHGIKINYYTGVEGDTILLTMPNCTKICPLQTFLNSVYDVLPKSAELLCNWRHAGDETLLESTVYGSSESHKLSSVIILFSFIIISFLH
ncbi:venom acid phosphatase Acph-1-like isoform X2 [Hylaeus volcanicus]|nr:venom acid phosphatase Acph-1-like isoform X2 [Hylaeus volcanicus]